MHEMGIADALLRTVEDIVAQERSSPEETVSRITVELGDLSGVVPRFLQECWQAVIDGTAYAHTALHLIATPALAKCEDCGKVFTAAPSDLRCPACHSDKLTPLSGTGMLVTEIELRGKDED